MILYSGITLYHGSYALVEAPDLAMCSPYKDFGKGFYLTTSKRQAAAFVKSAVAKAKRRGELQRDISFGYVSKYRFKPLEEAQIYEFEGADVQWLHCVAAHRRGDTSLFPGEEWANYDILAGKVANDRTNPTITAYLSGLFGEIGTGQADGRCIEMLLPDQLENQICLRTERALSCLVFEGSEKIVWQ
ncbi:MAG: DUF3990 domain-containing protein [Eubacteriales bacterium]|nr:DUF3990 domain-containing protein [Eubacteriales bacterium]